MGNIHVSVIIFYSFYVGWFSGQSNLEAIPIDCA